MKRQTVFLRRALCAALAAIAAAALASCAPEKAPSTVTSEETPAVTSTLPTESDEPTASLDRAAAQKVEDMILALKEKLSVIMVSHSLRQAAKLADYAVVLGDGQILGTFDSDGLNTALNDGSLVKAAF